MTEQCQAQVKQCCAFLSGGGVLDQLNPAGVGIWSEIGNNLGQSPPPSLNQLNKKHLLHWVNQPNETYLSGKKTNFSYWIIHEDYICGVKCIEADQIKVAQIKAEILTWNIIFSISYQSQKAGSWLWFAPPPPQDTKKLQGWSPEGWSFSSQYSAN